MITKQCIQCNKGVQIKPYRKDSFKFCSPQCRHISMKGYVPWNKDLKGIHLSLVTEFKKGMTPWNKGEKNYCVDCGELVWRKSERCKGCFAKWKFQIQENHPRWQGGLTKINRRLRGQTKWKNWRTAVFTRDNYTCMECGKRNISLEPHHIIPIRSDKEKTFDINNGITLCRPCHQKTIWKESNFAEKYSVLVAAQV